MGSVSAVYQFNGLNKTVSIPLPTDPTLIQSVILYNYSPYLVRVDVGSHQGWLGCWMADEFNNGSGSLKVTPTQVVGAPPASVPPIAQITAAFILTGDDDTQVGTYPVTLLGRFLQELDILNSDGTTAVQIGPGADIKLTGPTNTMELFFDFNNNPAIATYPNSGSVHNAGGMYTDPSGSVLINGAQYQSSQTGDIVQSQGYFTLNQIVLGTFNPSASGWEGAYLNLYSNSAYLMSQEVIGVPFANAYLQLNGSGLHTALINLNNATNSWVLFSVATDNRPVVSVGGETWHALPMVNWTGTAGFQTPQYTVLADHTVMLRGSLVPGVGASGTIGTLPVGYRPINGTVQFAVGGGASVAANASMRFGINTAGVMNISGQTGVGSFAVDGVRFSIDP